MLGDVGLLVPKHLSRPQSLVRVPVTLRSGQVTVGRGWRGSPSLRGREVVEWCHRDGVTS